MTEKLKITGVLDDIRQRYEDGAGRKKVNFLIYGNVGSGKTYSLRTLPGPILIHSFDPGGTKSVADEIDKGRIYVDSQFEKEDVAAPSAYKAWEREFNKLEQSGVFSELGTYVIDPGTRWADSCMNEIIKQQTAKGIGKGREKGVPQMADYNIYHTWLGHALLKITSIPCNFVLTCHVDTWQDTNTEKTYNSVMVYGKSKVKIPQLFDEVYVAKTATKGGKVDYVFQTSTKGGLDARSRISLGRLEQEEPQDFKAILEKTGYPFEDKNT